MRYRALASDYDDTLAESGVVARETLNALERLRESGRELILVTGRELPDLKTVFARLDLFGRVVAENGAVLYRPATREKLVLAHPVNGLLVTTLAQRGVKPLAVGDAIVATSRINVAVVREAIQDLELDMQIIFNKSSVMVLPPGVDKIFGLRVALRELGLSESEVVGVGDAENDEAFLKYCGLAVAVGNALPAVRDTADLITRANRGAGVTELIEMILKNDVTLQSANRTGLLASGKEKAGTSRGS